MSPADLAARHPRLYHVTEPAAWPSIRRHGLLSAAALARLFELSAARRERLLGARRPAAVTLEHPVHGRAVLNDNLPLSEAALERCLDDGLRPSDWLRMLNDQVFFWASPDGVERLLGARMNRHRPRLVLELDTLALAERHARDVRLCPINSGSTIRRPARRGLRTFAPMLEHGWQEWRAMRGRRDRVLEVTVLERVSGIESLLLDRWCSDAGTRAE